MIVQIALDLGGTTIKVALVSRGDVVAFAPLDAHAGAGIAESLPRIERAVAGLLEAQGLSQTAIAGVGIAFAGPVDAVRKRVVATNDKFDDAPRVDFAGWIRDAWNVPFAIDNDGRLSCLGEWKFGAGAGHSAVATITLGTGIGSGVVIHDRLLRGPHFLAGSLGGHIPIDFSGGRRCSCGNVGCAEAVASTWALHKDLAELDEGTRRRIIGSRKVEESGLKELFEAASIGDEVALAIRHRYLDAWGATAVALVHAYDPEVVVLDGGALGAGESVVSAVGEYVGTRAWTPGRRTKVTAGRFPNTAALIGAAYLAGGDALEII